MNKIEVLYELSTVHMIRISYKKYHIQRNHVIILLFVHSSCMKFCLKGTHMKFFLV